MEGQKPRGFSGAETAFALAVILFLLNVALQYRAPWNAVVTKVTPSPSAMPVASPSALAELGPIPGTATPGTPAPPTPRLGGRTTASPAATPAPATPAPPSPTTSAPADLTPLWIRAVDGVPVPDAVCFPLQDTGTFVVMTHYPHYAGQSEELALLGIDDEGGTIEWKVGFPQGMTIGDAVACVMKESVIVLTRGGTVEAYSRRDGKPQGKLDAPTSGGPVAIVGVDLSGAMLAGPGVAVQIDATAPAGTARPMGDAFVSLARLPGKLPVLGGGRGLAIVQDDDEQVLAIDIRSANTLWTRALRERAHTALVGDELVFVGTQGLWVLDRLNGNPLETVDMKGAIRRIDERHRWLHVLDGMEELTILERDTRKVLARRSASALGFSPDYDYVLHDLENLSVIDYADGTLLERRLTDPPRASPQGRLLLDDRHLHYFQHPEGHAHEIVCVAH